MKGQKVAAKKNWILRRKKALELWVKEVSPLMGLADWTIHYDWSGNEHTHPGHEGWPAAFATMTPYPSSKHVVLSVSRELLDLPPKEAHQVLVHELVHCHLFSLHEFSSGSFAMAAGRNSLALKLYESSLTQHIEEITDALADSFAPLLPMASFA